MMLWVDSASRAVSVASRPAGAGAAAGTPAAPPLPTAERPPLDPLNDPPLEAEFSAPPLLHAVSSRRPESSVAPRAVPRAGVILVIPLGRGRRARGSVSRQ